MKKVNQVVLYSFIVFVGILLSLPGFSQINDKGEITNWELINIPHGVSNPGKYYKARWDVIKLDATGGHIKAKLWVDKKPHCDAYADFKWDFFPQVKDISQDQKIRVNLSIKSNSSSKCKAPMDPGFSIFVMSGVMWDKKIGGDISRDGSNLMGYATKGSRRVGAQGLVPRNTDVYLLVKDRTSAGVDVDARDGGFGFELIWRGNTYSVFYKYGPRGLIDDYDDGSSGYESDLSGIWEGNWSNLTFGSSGRCRFTISIDNNDNVKVSGNEGFGNWQGKKIGQDIILHTIGNNNYEYWSIFKIKSDGSIHANYLGYGHKGRRKGQNWIGTIVLKKY